MNKIIMGCLAALAMASANAATWYEEATGYTWSYTVSGERATITGVSPKESDKGLPIPAEIGGKTVTSIREYAFSGCSGLTGALMIPEGVTNIGERSFYSCGGLTEVTIPASMTSIGEDAFYSCFGLKKVCVCDVKAWLEISFSTLYSNPLCHANHLYWNNQEITELIIPEGVTSIGDYAFYGCSGLTGPLTIPASVTSIGDYAFCCCSGLTGPLTIPASVTSIGDCAFSGCSGLTGSLTILGSLTSIPNGAFSQCSGLKSLKMPEGVTSIGNSAFFGCSGLTGPLTILAGVTSIGDYAFYGCSGLTGPLTIPASVTSIGNSVFYGCSGLTGLLTIPAGVTSIGDYAFSGCSGLTGPLTIPASVTSIGTYAFSGCSGLTGPLTIPAGVTLILDGVFSGCSGMTGPVRIPEGVTMIGNSAFRGCSGLTGPLTIPAGVERIGESAFEDCSGLTGLLSIQKGISSILTYAFLRCRGLTGLLLNLENLEYVGIGAFGLCNFQSATYVGEMPKWWKNELPYTLGVQLDRANSGSWLNGGLPIQNFAGYINNEIPAVTIISSKVREDDATVIDVTYKVTSAKPTVKVRVLAFEDGERSLAKVVRPETFVDGTAVNVGDGVTANEEHTISWKVSSDWATKLAKVKVEVLAVDDDILPLELMTLPATATQPKMQVSWNHVWPEKVFDALLWLYADKDEGLVLQDGVLKTGYKRLAQGTGLSDSIGFDARVYVFGKMGYELLDGERLEYVKARTRLDLPDKSVRQYAVKVME